MCRATNDEYPEFYLETHPKARKEHKCGECYRIIKSGEIYRYAVGRWDGNFMTHKMCAHCSELASWLAYECGNFLFNEIVDDCTEHVRERIGGMRLARAVVAANHQWRYFKKDGLRPVPQLSQI